MSDEQWVLYDTVSGDILERGSEQQIRSRYAHDEDAAAGLPYPFSAGMARASEIGRIQEAHRRQMSGNPPRDRSRRDR
jgi:hypothetical protein